MQIKVTHIGEDYATIEVDGQEFETSRGLGEAIIEAEESVKTTHFYSKVDFPEIGSVFQIEGNTYRVEDNRVIYESVAKKVA